MSNALPMVFVVAGGLCLALVLLALWHSVRGLVFRGAVVGSATHVASRERLLHEKQELLTAIRDVRLEHELGKVSDDDFARLEQSYRARARDVLRELDEQLAPHRAAAQQVLAQALGGATPSPNVAGDAEPSALPRAPIAPAPAVAGVCPRCAVANDVDAVFCKKCGERIAAELRP